MRVITYVEGRSDKQALEALLRPLIEQKAHEGVAIQFYEAPPGDKKVSVLRTVPRRPHDDCRAVPAMLPAVCPVPGYLFTQLG